MIRGAAGLSQQQVAFPELRLVVNNSLQPPEMRTLEYRRVVNFFLGGALEGSVREHTRA